MPAQEEINNNLTIFFGKTADTVIEKIIKTLPTDEIAVLVSSDRTLYNAVQTKDKIIQQIKAPEFWQNCASLPKQYQTQKYPENNIASRLTHQIKQKLDKLRKEK